MQVTKVVFKCNRKHTVTFTFINGKNNFKNFIGIECRQCKRESNFMFISKIISNNKIRLKNNV